MNVLDTTGAEISACELALQRLLSAYIAAGLFFLLLPGTFFGVQLVIARGWLCWALWISGVFLRWITNLYGWQWRGLLPLSAFLEITAFLIFFLSVSHHKKQHMDAPRPSARGKGESWMKLVLSSTIGFLLTLLANAVMTVQLGFSGHCGSSSRFRSGDSAPGGCQYFSDCSIRPAGCFYLDLPVWRLG